MTLNTACPEPCVLAPEGGAASARSTPAGMSMEDFRWRDIVVSLRDGRLRLANREIERVLDLSAGYPKTRSFRRRATGREYAAEREDPDSGFIGLTPPGAFGRKYVFESGDVRAVPASRFDGEHVEAEIVVTEPTQQLRFRRVYFLYPEFPGLSVRAYVRSGVLPNLYWLRRGNLARERNRHFDDAYYESCVDGIKLAAGLRARRAVEFFARTDGTDRYVTSHDARGKDVLAGNLLWCAFRDGAGALWLQEAPTSEERRDFEAHDFRLADGAVYSCGWGVGPEEFVPGREYASYRHTTILAEGPAERDRLLLGYQKRRFPPRPEQNAVTVNAWGCGRFRERLDESFLLDEIAAAGRLGADIYQVDEGWHRGGGLAEMVHANRRITPEFWDVSPALGGSLDSLRTAAERAGVKLGLWWMPSANVGYRDWKAMREALLALHRRWDIEHFKIDGVLLRGYEAEENLERLLRGVRDASGGRIHFNLDITSGQRGGYFRFLEYGNLFLENRYVCHDWGLGYHPEKTLRNFWRLARYVRAQHLQIEIPDPGDIRRSFYEARGLTPPDRYPYAYWVALAAFANPLLWLAPSRQAPEHAATLRATLALFAPHRAAFAEGDIFPVGAEPDGAAVTGFYSTGGYLLALREYDAPPTARFGLPDGAKGRWRLLGGAGSAVDGPDGVAVTIGGHPRFAFFQQA